MDIPAMSFSESSKNRAFSDRKYKPTGPLLRNGIIQVFLRIQKEVRENFIHNLIWCGLLTINVMYIYRCKME